MAADVPSTDRRQLLSALGTLPGAVLLSGCTTLLESSAHLQELSLSNRWEIAHDLHVRVTANGELVYETERTLGSWEEEQLPCEWPTGASEYERDTTVDETADSSLTLDSGEHECVMVSMSPQDDVPQFQRWDPCPHSPESSTPRGERCYESVEDDD